MNFPRAAILLLAVATSWSALAVDGKLPSFIVKDQRDLKALQARANKADKGSQLETWLHWQIALNAPLVGSTDLAVTELKGLNKSKQTLIGKDQIELTLGRVYFQKGRFKEALRHYQAVPKTSEYWFEALEEQAWSYIRQNQAEQATAKLTTLLSPVFQTWVGPETYFAANYNALKVCDYTTVFKNGQKFKERHAYRLKELEQLAEQGKNSQTDAVINRLASGELNFMNFAPEAPALPRFFWRDEFLRRDIDTLRANANPEVQKDLRENMRARLQALAKSELSEYKTVIQKLNLMEAEVIQRLYLDENLKGERPEMKTSKSDPNVLTFPEVDELWLDEIDSYQAHVKSCPQLKEAHL